MSSYQDNLLTDQSSIEFDDAVVDESFMATVANNRSFSRNGKTAVDVESGDVFNRMNKYFTDKALLRRIDQHEANELKVFIAQKLFKVDGILCDEQARLAIITKMLTSDELLNDTDEMDRKYGRQMAAWLRDRLFPSVADCSSVLKIAANEFNRLKKLDPLCNWYSQSPELAAQVATRISRFAAHMAGMVRWSLLVEPGKFSCHLTEFASEFHRLEMMCTHELSHDEAAHTAFNANYLTKARSKNVTCVDMTRVRLLHSEREETREPLDTVVHRLFDGEQIVIESGKTTDTYGTGDFIHASYVRGGPLLNSFICTQAPMQTTQHDFWKMVYQEKSRLIVMLCSAVDVDSLGPLDRSHAAAHCPYYWPRCEGGTMEFGDLTVRNLKVDGTADPLFTITHLEISKGDDDSVLLVEHWQWDWQNMGDVYWPFRVLRKARLSPTPTVVHCMDGCTRSGTLVAIETVLAHFLRGAPLEVDVVLMCSMFVRLQRRHAIGSPLHYIFIYRCVLHWLSPYVTSMYPRIALGLTWNSIGFIAKYEDMVKQHCRISPAY